MKYKILVVLFLTFIISPVNATQSETKTGIQIARMMAPAEANLIAPVQIDPEQEISSPTTQPSVEPEETPDLLEPVRVDPETSQPSLRMAPATEPSLIPPAKHDKTPKFFSSPLVMGLIIFLILLAGLVSFLTLRDRKKTD